MNLFVLVGLKRRRRRENQSIRIQKHSFLMDFHMWQSLLFDTQSQIDWHIHNIHISFYWGHMCASADFILDSIEIVKLHDAAEITVKQIATKKYSFTCTHTHIVCSLFVKFWCVKSQQNATFCNYFRHSHLSIHPPSTFVITILRDSYVMNKSYLNVSSIGCCCRRCAYACVSLVLFIFVDFLIL